MPLPNFLAGSKLRASDLRALLPLSVVKPTDENVISSTTMQNDDALLLSIAANTNYWLDLILFATEATGTTADLKVGWTMPTGCKLDMSGPGPHQNWVSAAQLEVEWAALYGQTSSPTAALMWGTINAGVIFGYHGRGIVRNGANAGTLQLQWAQAASVAENVTVKAGSVLKLTQI